MPHSSKVGPQALALLVALAAVGGGSCGAPASQPGAASSAAVRPSRVPSPPVNRVYALVAKDQKGPAGIQQYDVDEETGALRAVERTPFERARSIAAPATGGLMSAVACENVRRCTLSTFAIGPSGRLAPSGPTMSLYVEATNLQAAGASVAFRWSNNGTFISNGIDLYRRAPGGQLRQVDDRMDGLSAYGPYNSGASVGAFALGRGGTRVYQANSGHIYTYELGDEHVTLLGQTGVISELGRVPLETPDGKFLNVLSSPRGAPTAASLATFRLDEQGVPAFAGAMPAAAGSYVLAQAPDGRFLFVESLSGIETYWLDGSGLPVWRSILAAKIGPIGGTVTDVGGRFLYVSRYDTSDILGLAIDPRRGELRELGSLGPGGGALVSLGGTP